jgi:hypothetical protein
LTDQTIGVAEPVTPTKQLQSYQNTVSGNVVQAEAIVQVDLNGNPILAADNSTNSTKKTPTLPGVAGLAAPSYTSGNQVPLSLNLQGAVRVNIASSSATVTTTANQGTAGVSDWPVIIKGDSTTTPGTNVKPQIDDATFSVQGLRPLLVENVGTVGAPFKQDPADNSSIVTFSDFTIGGNTLVNAGDTVTAAAQGKATISFDVLGSFTGNPVLVFEQQVGSATFAGQPIYDIVNKVWLTSLSPITGQHYFLVAQTSGFPQSRLRLTNGVASGNITVTYDETSTARFLDRTTSAPGQPIPTEALMIGGSDGTNLRSVGVSASGQVAIQNPPNLPALTLDPQGNLQVNNNTLRGVEERIMMLTELTSLNDIISRENGTGARNYQELR